MAYIARHSIENTEWHGPCPDEAGEFCGNIGRNEIRLEDNSKAIQGMENKRVGRPSDCEAGLSDELIAEGFVGLYLINDSRADIVDHNLCRKVDTDILQEEVVSGQRPPLRSFNPGVPMVDHSCGLQWITDAVKGLNIV